jgi:hypothetical protein
VYIFNLLFLMLTVLVGPGPDALASTELLAAVHVHSDFSTGTLSLDQLAEEAERLGLDAIVLADNLVLRYEYGLVPLHGIIRRRIRYPSVYEHGVEQYLAAVAAVQARHPQLILVPGVEVMPYYYWTGSLLERTLTMHDSQKNLLVLGLATAEDYESLPIVGLPAHGRFDWATAVELSPALLAAPSLWLWHRSRSGRGMLDWGSHGYRITAVVLGGIATVLVYNAWPFTQPTFSPYATGLSYRPYQALINAVAARGGVTIWSMPEARDFHRYEFGMLVPVTVTTDPYPEALVLTAGYTGFGGVYEDTRSMIEPGQIWDQAIGLYLNGERSRPPVMTAESSFHGPGDDNKALDQVLTVLTVRERSQAGILEALRTGRLYAVVRARKEFRLRLDSFQVQIDGGRLVAHPGDVLDPEGARDVGVRVALSASDGGRYPVAVRLIRSGQVLAQHAGETPLRFTFEDSDVPPGQWHAYRLDAHGPMAGELLSNPIFVGPVPAVETGGKS